jgi:N-acetylneuraminic acid mutarotase
VLLASVSMGVDASHFRAVGHLPVGLRYAAVAAVGTNLVIAGGVTGVGPVRSVYVFDTTTGRVAKSGDLPAALGHAVAFTLGSIVYVAGGLNAAGNAVRSVTAIDVEAHAVTALRPLPSGVSDAAVVSDGTTAWLLGGWRGTALTRVLRATISG